jgi:hypothetical protein
MSEPVLERLSRFTPNAGGLDRDALLFAAGRGSARPSRGWITLATLLANTQILSLVFLWPRPTPPLEGRLTVAAAVDPVILPPMTLETQTSAALASARTWSSRRRLVEPDKDERDVDSVTLIDSGPPLKILGPLPPSLLN